MVRKYIILLLSSIIVSGSSTVYAAQTPNIVDGEYIEYWQEVDNWEDYIDSCDSAESDKYIRENGTATEAAVYGIRAKKKKVFIGYHVKGTPFYVVWHDGNCDTISKERLEDLITEKGYVAYVVRCSVYNIESKYKSKTLKIGQTFKFMFDRDLDNYDIKSIKYYSSNKKVATVDKDGVITAKKAGKVKITSKVTSNCGDVAEIKMAIKVKK